MKISSLTSWPPALPPSKLSSTWLLNHVVKNSCFKKIKTSKTLLSPSWLAGPPRPSPASPPPFSISLANFPRAPRGDCRNARVHKCNHVVSRDLIFRPHIYGQLSCLKGIGKCTDLPLGPESRFGRHAEPPCFQNFPPLQRENTSYLEWTARLN